MTVQSLELKFNTNVFSFRDVEQLAAFLRDFCFRDKQGVVWLHHGCEYHHFTELDRRYYQNIPDRVKWRNSKRTNFMRVNLK